MADFQKRLLKWTIQQHLSGDEVVKQMVEWGRDQIQKAVDAKQVLIEGFEHNSTTADGPLAKQLLMDEQVLNRDFMKTLNAVIDLLQHHIKQKKDKLESPDEDEYDDDGEDDDDDDDA